MCSWLLRCCGSQVLLVNRVRESGGLCVYVQHIQLYLCLYLFQYFSIHIADQEFIPVPLIPTQYHSILSSFFLFLICSSTPFSDSDEPDFHYVTSILSLLPPRHARTLFFLLRLWYPMLGHHRPHSSSADMKNSSHSLAHACFAQCCLMAFILNHGRGKARKKLTYLKPFLVYYT